MLPPQTWPGLFRKNRRSWCFLALLGACLLAPVETPAGDWPGWRGPGGLGVSGEKNLPTRWSATQNVRWRIPLEGAGVSNPVVWGQRVFVTASDGRLNDQLHVSCYHRADGRKLTGVKNASMP